MLSVQQAVRALRQEILAALADESPLPVGVSLVADRVSVSLGVQLDPANVTAAEVGDCVVATDSANCLHRVTVEFRVEPSGRPNRSQGEVTVHAPLAKIEAKGAEHPAFAALTEVFGPPGFDSSARATVFREALEELNEEQRRHVLLSIRSSPSADEDTVVSQARHLVRRLVGSGPAGAERGPELLRQLATEHSVPDLIQLATDRWRTQSEWTAASSATTGAGRQLKTGDEDVP